MRYLIISDIHANRPALDAVLADAGTVGYDAVLCLGDLVGYGAHPGAVVDRVQALAPVGLIRGNHDKVCAGLEAPTLFNDAARASVEWTRASLDERQRQILVALPTGPVRVTTGIDICHGAPFDEDHYVFDMTSARRALAATSAHVCFCGHTHVPAVFAERGGAVIREIGDGEHELQLPPTGKTLVNVGAVGQPRDGDPRAAYGIYDVPRGVIRLRRVAYDIAAAQAAILDAGLPEWLALRLERGQ